MVSEAQKKSSRRWDRIHMRSLSCRLRTEDADLFRQHCTENNTTPGTLLKQYVNSIIEEYKKTLPAAGEDESK